MEKKKKKIAIISDIHGNITALDAVFEDIENRGIKRVFCLGDMLIKCSSPEKCVEKTLKKCEVVIKGNCEDRVVSTPRIEEHFWNKNRLYKEQIDKTEYKNYDFILSKIKINPKEFFF